MTCLRTICAMASLGAIFGVQVHHEQSGFNPDMNQCQMLAKPAENPQALLARPASDLNELDWKLSVCVGKFLPMYPSGVPLILDAHGNVSDELRVRIEKAVKTLPLEEQAKVWAAFNSDQGSSR